MKSMKRIIATLVLVLLCIAPFACIVGIAASVDDSFPLSDSPEIILPTDFVMQLVYAIRDMGGAGTLAQVAVIVTLLVSSMKVTVLNQLVWQRLGPFKVLAAPLFALVAGVVGLGAQGAPPSLARVVAYLSAGAGAIVLHQLLDALKAVPGLGPWYANALEVVSRTLGATESDQAVKGKE